MTGLKINTFKLIHVAKRQADWVNANLDSKKTTSQFNLFKINTAKCQKQLYRQTQ